MQASHVCSGAYGCQGYAASGLPARALAAASVGIDVVDERQSGRIESPAVYGTEGYRPMIARRDLLILLTLVGSVVWNHQAILAAPIGTTVHQDASIAGDVGDTLPVPVDPVIEEPLRPLYPAGEVLSSDGPTRCGSMGLLAPAFALLLLHTLRFCPRRRTC